MADKSQRRIVLPGDIICKESEHTPGSGTYVQQGYVLSSTLGWLNFAEESVNDKPPEVSVQQKRQLNVVPSPGDVVTAKVMSVNPRFCKCNIICIKNIVLQESFRGIIRKEDVYAMTQDSVQMYLCFRPGDILLAKVLSIGNAHSYILSTAENELGVVVAYSDAGVPLVPISWTEMQCPKTYTKEHRKVAKAAYSSKSTPEVHL